MTPPPIVTSHHMHRNAPAWQQGGGNSAAAVAAVVVAAAAWRKHSVWQRSGGVWLGSAAAHHCVIGTWPRQPPPTPWLPPCAATVVMKTPAVIVMAGAQTIINQLKTRKRCR